MVEKRYRLGRSHLPFATKGDTLTEKVMNGHPPEYSWHALLSPFQELTEKAVGGLNPVMAETAPKNELIFWSAAS